MTAPVTGLRGAKVRLRALVREDNEILRGFVNDPEVMRFSNTYRPISDLQQERWWDAAMHSPTATWFGIDDVRREPTKLVGSCCLVDQDAIARMAELRIRIGAKDVWGQGLGSEASTLLVGFGFGQLQLERIWLRVFSNNPRAQRMYESLGFVLEGRLRRAAFLDGGFHDVILMGLLRSEWRGPASAGPSQPA